MAMFFEKSEPLGQALISTELATARSYLKDRQGELAKAERNIAELKATCERLTEKITNLERDQRALQRGYIALMGDAAASGNG